MSAAAADNKTGAPSAKPVAGAAELSHLAGTAAAKTAGWDSTEISFPYVLEDPLCELHALQVWRDDQKKRDAAAAAASSHQTVTSILKPKPAGIRVLTVASGGDVALAIGAETDVSVVHGIDLNRGQIHACRLKQVAYERLSVDNCLDFLMNADPPAAVGSSEQLAEAKRRAETFAALQPHLPADTQQFWSTEADAARHTQLINGGLFSFGFRQKEIPALTIALRKAGLHPYEHASAVRDPANAKAWEDIWRANFLSRLPGQKVGPKIGNLVRAALLRSESDGNHWFVRSFFGRPHASQLPLFLTRRSEYPAHATDAKRVDSSKVTFEYKELAEALEAATANGTGYDFVNTSNVFDSIPTAFRARALTALAAALKPGGIALFRTGPMDVYDLPAGGVRALVGEYLEVDTTVSDHLKANEKYLIYWDCILARKKTAASATATAAASK